MTEKFICGILENLDTDQKAEKQKNLEILHKLYAKLVPRRKLIRRVMQEYLLMAIHEGRVYQGVGEILEIYPINGFAVPLREEPTTFFKKIMVQILKLHNFNDFYEFYLRRLM